jgi:hypothetical protein
MNKFVTRNIYIDVLYTLQYALQYAFSMIVQFVSLTFVIWFYINQHVARPDIPEVQSRFHTNFSEYV